MNMRKQEKMEALDERNRMLKEKEDFDRAMFNSKRFKSRQNI